MGILITNPVFSLSWLGFGGEPVADRNLYVHALSAVSATDRQGLALARVHTLHALLATVS